MDNNNTQTTFLRLFFAVMPDDHLKEMLIKFIHSLKKLPFKHHIHWTKPDNLHLTLHFIGKTPEDKIPQLIQKVQQRIALLPDFNLKFNRLLLFPPKYPHVLTLGITPSLPLVELIDQITQGVIDAELAGDKKPYIPHITLGKLKQLPRIELYHHKINFPPLSVQQITLLQSVPEGEETRYEVLKTLTLA